MRATVICLALSACVGALPAVAQEAEPFHTRNLSPAIAIFGLPTWEALTAEHVFTATADLANHYRLSQRGPDTLILDGETARVGFYYSHPLGERWAVSAELPVIQQSGGVLDDLIDGWHSAFGMPDGGRNNRPEDELLYHLASNAQPFYVLDEDGRGLGDLQVSIARRFGMDGRFVARTAVKFATGRESILAGSGSTDWSITLLRPRSVTLRGGRAAGYYWGAGVLALGEPVRIAFPAKEHAIVGVLGGSLAILPRFGMKVQLDVHSALYDTPLEELGQDAVLVTIGGWWAFEQRGRLDFGVIEDLHVSTAPDVVLHAALRWRW